MAVTSQCCPLLLVLGVVALHVAGVYGHYEHTCSLSTRRRGPHRAGLCGDSLAQILSLLCGNGYAGSFTKRSVPDSPGGKVAEKRSLSDIVLNKKDALSYLHKRDTRRTRRDQGITCECCYNSCTVLELKEYCN